MTWVQNPNTGKPVKKGSRTYNSIYKGIEDYVYVNPLSKPPNDDIDSAPFKIWIKQVNTYYLKTQKKKPKIEIVDMSKRIK